MIKVFLMINNKNEVSESLKKIPDFSFLTLDGNIFSKKDLHNGLSTVFIYFNSECDYCQNEAKYIKENLRLFKNVQFVFVSEEKEDIILKFAKKYKLNSENFISFLSDNNNLFIENFGANSVPYILIYDRNQNLVKKHVGELNINSILKELM